MEKTVPHIEGNEGYPKMPELTKEERHLQKVTQQL
jgi:hypothetical protein